MDATMDGATIHTAKFSVLRDGALKLRLILHLCKMGFSLDVVQTRFWMIVQRLPPRTPLLLESKVSSHLLHYIQ